MHRTFTLLLLLVISTSSLAYRPNEGDAAPDFEMTSINGERFKLSDYKGKQSVYVVFWNTWCHYCMKKIPKLKAAQTNLADDIKIIAVNTSRKDSLEESLDFQKRFKINYMLTFDDNEVVTDLYNVHGVPTEFIVDINGIIRHRDGVPENLSKYVTKWNAKGYQSFSHYWINLFSQLNPIAQNTIFWNVDFSQLLNSLNELESTSQS